MTEKIVHVRISGKVQGVYYRAWTQEAALDLGLSGWVRNCKDGSVEATLCGDETSVAAMLAACMEGSPSATVNNIEHLETASFSGSGFDILPTI
jgi:acylphosphatase